MSRRGTRQIVFVCVSLANDGNLISQIIAASSEDEAAKLFYDQYFIKPKDILGPFYRKRKQVFENIRTLRFTNQTKKAIYNDWLVNAFLLQEPDGYAYLVFVKRMDDKKIPIPKGTITVPISDLRFI